MTKSSSFAFESLNPSNPAFQTTGDGENDYSYVSYTPPAGTAVSQITDLEANASFTTGHNAWGAPRWSITTTAGSNWPT